MKRKSLIKSCLLGGALLLGTGYAAINSKNVTISGTVSAANLDLNVGLTLYWDNSNFPDGVSSRLDESCGAGVCSLTFETPENLFQNSGDEYRILMMFINNEPRVDVKVSKATITNTNEDIFSVRTTWEEEWTMSLTGNELQWDEIRQYIYISMDKLPITEEESTATITIEFTLTPVRIN